MDTVFSGNEIVELGIQIEKNGRDFYSTLSKLSKNQAIGEVFEFLAQEEGKHIGIFKSILKKSNEFEFPQVYSDEYSAYMNALAGEYVFTRKDKGKDIAKKISGDNEAIEMGIGFEKDSIIFYEGIKKIVAEKDKQIVDGLIREEEKHYLRLSDLKQKITRKGKKYG